MSGAIPEAPEIIGIFAGADPGHCERLMLKMIDADKPVSSPANTLWTLALMAAANLEAIKGHSFDDLTAEFATGVRWGIAELQRRRALHPSTALN